MNLTALEAFDRLNQRVTYTEGVYSAKKKSLETLLKEVEFLASEQEILTKVQKVLSHLMDKLVKKDMVKMDKLINYGLDIVFPDRNITFKSELKDTGKKFFIDLKTFDNGEELADGSFGSVSVVESFLLRLLCILKLKRAKFLILDETFSAVGNDYINNVGYLVAELAKKLGMDILLVTHNPGVVNSTVFNAKYTKKKGLILTKFEEKSK